jgi:hypothetical protein
MIPLLSRTKRLLFDEKLKVYPCSTGASLVICGKGRAQGVWCGCFGVLLTDGLFPDGNFLVLLGRAEMHRTNRSLQFVGDNKSGLNAYLF